MNDVHKLVVAELSREGSGTPGTFRTHDVKIKNSSVVLSPWMQVPQHMEELFSLVTGEKSISIAMLKHVAAHHHYTVIHPYDNGNGRTARIFTYACLLRDGFSLVEKVINPTAVFCRSRNKYYDMLSRADSATEEGVTEWCFYVLEGMKDEFACIKKLADGSFVRKEIVSQVLSHAKMRNAISEREHSILSCAIQADEITLEKLEETIPNLSQGRYSQIGKELAERQLLREVRRGAYVISFDGPLLRGLIKALDAHNFLPMRDESIASV
jgi:Fic family protein